MVKKKRNPSDAGGNPIGSSNGDMLGYRLSNSLSLLNVQLEFSTPYLITMIESYPNFRRNQLPPEELLCFLSILGNQPSELDLLDVLECGREFQVFRK